MMQLEFNSLARKALLNLSLWLFSGNHRDTENTEVAQRISNGISIRTAPWNFAVVSYS